MKAKLFSAAIAATLFVSPALSFAAKKRPARRTAHAAARPAPQEPRAARDTGAMDAPAARTQTLPIRRVTLYSNGVAYIERRGTVVGHAEIALSFKQSQVDDVLKSMVVLDLGQGRIGAVSYNSSAPPAARMADIPFSVASQSEGGGLAGILAQLQGARVVVTTRQGAAATGAILTVERRDTRPDPDRPSLVVTAHSLVITSETGELMSFDLEDVRSVKLADEGTRRDVNEFARATASARRRDAKTIVVTSDGAGAREMVVSYTVAAPIWKTTYRTVFDAAGKPFFQGWAVVDNVSEEDWIDVQLSLISGTPISFIMPVQQPFYRYRPVVPVPTDLKLHPQTHDPLLAGGYGAAATVAGVVTDQNGAAVPSAAVAVRNNSTGQVFTAQTAYNGEFQTAQLPPGSYTVTVSAQGFSQSTVTNVAVTADAPTNIGVNLRAGSVAETVVTDGVAAQRSVAARQLGGLTRAGGRGLPNSVNNLGFAASSADAPPPPPKEEIGVSDALTSGRSGVEAAAEGGEVGDLFEYQIQHPVTVRRDRSALIPIVQTQMEGARVSIFNESVRRDRPMSGLLLKNTTNLTLEDGALTVIDGNAYAGEALLERLKPQEQRLVSFALDLGTLVGVQQKADRAPASIVRIKDGVFQVHFFQEDRKVYTVVNQTDRPRVLYVEHPVRQGWELAKETRAPEGRSNRYYRFRVELGPNERAELPVTERRAQVETYALANFTRPQLDLFFSRKYIDEPTRAALQKMLDLKTQIAKLDERAAAGDREIEEIGQDQERLRENIEALAKTPEARALITRYVQKADQQETRIEQLTREKQALAQERERLQSQLDAAVRALTLDRNLTE
jgi:hypothetical protein